MREADCYGKNNVLREPECSVKQNCERIQGSVKENKGTIHQYLAYTVIHSDFVTKVLNQLLLKVWKL